jgi:NitT/TauT family transport system substrate-binding protein
MATRREFIASLSALALAGPSLSAAADKNPIRINIPGPGSLPFLPIDLIPRLELDRKLGVQLNIRYFPSGIHAMESMLAGEAEFAGFAFSVVPKMQAKGTDIVAVAPLGGATPRYAVIARKALSRQIKTLSDLKGHSLGVALGNQQSKTYMQTLGEQLLASAGIRPDQVRWVGTSHTTDGLVGAMSGTAVDAVFCEEPFITILVKRKMGFIIADLDEPTFSAGIPGLHHLRASISSTRARLAQDPSLAKHLIAMLKQSLIWINSHQPEEIVARLGVTDPLEREERINTLRYSPGTFSEDTRFSRRQLLATKDFLLATTNLAAEQIQVYRSIDSRWAGMKP